jgi:hypothetical protein
MTASTPNAIAKGDPLNQNNLPLSCSMSDFYVFTQATIAVTGASIIRNATSAHAEVAVGDHDLCIDSYDVVGIRHTYVGRSFSGISDVAPNSQPARRIATRTTLHCGFGLPPEHRRGLS